jgi:hypothetical protein
MRWVIAMDLDDDAAEAVLLAATPRAVIGRYVRLGSGT